MAVSAAAAGEQGGGWPSCGGSPNIGGPIVTAGGLDFIGATMDRKIRAFDLRNGSKVWEADLPAFAMATPMPIRRAGVSIS